MTIEGISVFSRRGLRIRVEGSAVAEVSDLEVSEGLPYVAPGLVDLQVNGYQGIDYTAESLAEEDVHRLIVALARSGTTTHLPTIITAPEERILRNLRLLTRLRETSSEIAMAIPGYHVEGPFISREDGPRGAHSLAHVRDADYDEYLRWQEAADGLVKLVTIAPEVPRGLAFIERVSQEGVLVAIGHTGAPPQTIRDAIKAGARLSTHLGNGSHAMIPRLKNYLWEQLGADELVASIISDGYHLPGAVVRTMSRAKGLDRLVLVSDVAVHGGAEPGVYPWGDNMVEVFADGHLGLYKTEFLAGAGHLLDHDLAQFMRFSGAALADALRLSTGMPARLLGLPPRDELRAGKPADLVLFDYEPGFERLDIRATIQAGRLLYDRQHDG